MTAQEARCQLSAAPLHTDGEVTTSVKRQLQGLTRSDDVNQLLFSRLAPVSAPGVTLKNQI